MLDHRTFEHFSKQQANLGVSNLVAGPQCMVVVCKNQSSTPDDQAHSVVVVGQGLVARALLPLLQPLLSVLLSSCTRDHLSTFLLCCWLDLQVALLPKSPNRCLCYACFIPIPAHATHRGANCCPDLEKAVAHTHKLHVHANACWVRQSVWVWDWRTLRALTSSVYSCAGGEGLSGAQGSVSTSTCCSSSQAVSASTCPARLTISGWQQPGACRGRSQGQSRGSCSTPQAQKGH